MSPGVLEWKSEGCWTQEPACPLPLCLVTSQQLSEMQPLWREGGTRISLGSCLWISRAWTVPSTQGGSGDDGWMEDGWMEDGWMKDGWMGDG